MGNLPFIGWGGEVVTCFWWTGPEVEVGGTMHATSQNGLHTNHAKVRGFCPHRLEGHITAKQKHSRRTQNMAGDG